MVRSAAVTLLCALSLGWLSLATGATAADTAAPATAVLPAQGLNKHMGVTSCASSVCHGAVTPSKTYDVLLNEYVTWSHDDAHSKAFNVLRSLKSRAIAAKLGIGDPAVAKECLDCHTDNVPPQQRGEK